MRTDTEASSEAGRHNLFALITRTAAERSAQPFLRLTNGQVITFGHMLEHAARVARWLQNCGLRPGDRIVAQLEKSPAALLLYLGCVRGGFVFVPLNTAYTAPEVAYFLSDAQPALVVASQTSPAASIATAARREQLAPRLEDAPWLPFDLDGPVAAVGPHDPAAILYTSGTTGRSKGAVLTHGNLSSNALVLHDVWRWQDGDVLMHALPIFHAHGLFVALHGALLNGSTIIFHERFEAAAVIDALPSATVFMGVPTFYTRLLDDPRLDTSSCKAMRVFISGSAPLLEATFLAFRERTGHDILERYGMTEALMVTSNPYEGPRRPGTVGRPLPGVDVRIMGEDGEPAGRDQPGLLQLKGPNLFSGYWRNPEKTAQDHTSDGYFISGDVAERDGDDFIKIVGRTKDLIISGGFNVYPKEIEMMIDALPGVVETAVIGVPHPDFGEGVVAVVVAQRGVSLDLAAIRAAAASGLAAFKRPKDVVVVEDLPRNAMGKVQKGLLRTRYASLFARP